MITYQTVIDTDGTTSKNAHVFRTNKGFMEARFNGAFRNFSLNLGRLEITLWKAR